MSRTQTRQIVIRLSEKDFLVLKEKVLLSGMSQAEFLRQAILKKKIVSTEGMRSIVPELKRIGNNINQIARKCNEGYQPSYTEIKKISVELGIYGSY